MGAVGGVGGGGAVARIVTSKGIIVSRANQNSVERRSERQMAKSLFPFLMRFARRYLQKGDRFLLSINFMYEAV